MKKMISESDPYTRIPKFKLPPLTCDAHTHIFGPTDKYPYAPERLFTPSDAPLEMFQALHEKMGIERAVIVNHNVYGTDNRVALDAVSVSNGRYRAVANIDDTIEERDLECLHRGGFRGCRFNFVQRLGCVPDAKVFERVLAKIKPLGWHVDLLFEAVDIPEYVPMLRRLSVRYVIAHMGHVEAAKGLDQKPFQALLELMKNEERCWVKVSGCDRVSATGAPFLDVVPFARQLVEAAPDRVIWGTDWPHPKVKQIPDDSDLVDFVPLFAPEAELQQRILVENPSRFYEFDT